jgi:hypothetical protein
MDEAELSSAKDTAYGLLCSITEFCDHERRAMSTDHDSIQHGLVQVQPLNNEDLNKPSNGGLKLFDSLKLFSVLFKLSQLI